MQFLRLTNDITPTQFHFPFAARYFNENIAHNCFSLSLKELDKLAVTIAQHRVHLKHKHKLSSSAGALAKRMHRPHTPEQEENCFYTTPTASTPSSSRFLWWNRPRLCNWDICRKQVTHSGMCVA